jgi:hypothetical protein
MASNHTDTPATPRRTETFQTPDWETPTNPRPKKGIFEKFGGYNLPRVTLPNLPSASAAFGRGRLGKHHDPAYTKETGDVLPTHTNTFGSATAGATTISAAKPPPSQNPRSPWQARFDALLPPHKTYPFHLNRTKFLLFIILPTLVFFLLILPLALGLGLRNRSSSSPQNLPLPTNTEVHKGDLTFYDPGMGACGWIHGVNDEVCAVSHFLWDALQVGTNPNTNSLCGKKLRVRREVEGGGGFRSVDVTVVDRCTGCQPTDIDLSPGVFNRLANPDLGRVVGEWAWL